MKHVILYTMKGCPHCFDMKNLLDENNIVYSEKDIDEHKEEYDLFVEATGSEYIPAFMLLNIGKNNKTSDVKLMVPDDDFDDLDEALYKVRRYLD